MSVVIIILAVLAGIIGIAGSILPGLPGPPISWAGLLILYLWGNGTNGAGDPISTKFLLIWLAITIVVCIVDYVVPAYFTRITGGSKAAGRGAIIGLIVGMFVPPVGIILGTLGGAFLAEFLVSRKDGWESSKSAIGALLGFFFGTGIKLIASGLMMYYIIVFIR
ncbi:MAG: DUF456 domain-containing protein [Bacteroidales bacterium]|nr:DUF456 domain-containing protein [Bacteroidales bacterium]